MNNNLYNPRDPVHRWMDRAMYIVLVAGVIGCSYLTYVNFMRWTA